MIIHRIDGRPLVIDLGNERVQAAHTRDVKMRVNLLHVILACLRHRPARIFELFDSFDELRIKSLALHRLLA